MGLKYDTPIDDDEKHLWIENRLKYISSHIKAQQHCPAIFWDVHQGCLKRNTRAWDHIVEHLVSRCIIQEAAYTYQYYVRGDSTNL